MSPDCMSSQTPRERLDELQRQLSSRPYMREVMRKGKAHYWKWRAATQKEVDELTLQLSGTAALKFTTDLEALAAAYDLLHTLSSETDMEPEEEQVIHNLRAYIKERSELAVPF